MALIRIMSFLELEFVIFSILTAVVPIHVIHRLETKSINTVIQYYFWDDVQNKKDKTPFSFSFEILEET